MADTNRNREVVLLPWQYVYLRQEKGDIKVLVGPYKFDLGTAEALVVWDRSASRYNDVNLEDAKKAVQQMVIVDKGSYAVLANPAKGSPEHPETGKGNATVDLAVGQTINVQGPGMFALWPGQSVDIVKGHHLSRNQYVRIQIADPVEARANWNKAAVSAEVTVLPPDGDTATAPIKKSSFFDSPPADLAMGKTYNVRGDQVSFYMPPTGVTVVADPETSTPAAPVYVREAVTLQTLQYAIAEDENGTKRYVRGPDVVFPEPTEEFRYTMEKRKDPSGAEETVRTTVFRALELNAIQRIHLKFSKDVPLRLLGQDGKETEKSFKAGDEVSFTGAELPIYYPEEGHQLVTYDGKLVHYAVQVSEGEGRYVLERMTGNVKLVTGPEMLLPDPTKEIVAQRPLTDQQVKDWFPGPDGAGSPEALVWNRQLRERANTEPGSRQGVVSAARVGLADMDVTSNLTYGAAAAAVPPMRRSGTTKEAFVADMSRQGKSQRLEGDSVERGATFTSPRAVTLFNKFNGVPLIDLYPGFAVSLVHANGSREVVVGPKKILLGFGDTLDTLQVSTKKPKTTDVLQRVTYLQTQQNRISDIIELVTKDNVKISVKLSYIVNFEGDTSRWFTISNFVKHLCDRVRSILKSMVRKRSAKEFYGSAADFIRDTILGASKEGEEGRPGMRFTENGMHVVDVDVLAVEMLDERIKRLFEEAQRQVVVDAIEVEQSDAALAVFRKKEENVRATESEKAATEEHRAKITLKSEQLGRNVLDEESETEKKKREMEAAEVAGRLEREKAESDQRVALLRAEQDVRIEMLKEETAATVARFEKVAPGFTAALLALKDADVLVKVAQALSAQMLLGGKNAVDVFQQAVKGTPLEPVFAKIAASAGAALPGNGAAPTQRL